ncbi:hypothetical protein EDD86DRAFT_214192 [Gorgonomyces haynaldii]|nr:hypothetical protein EDD86DRAFT_214192 [Gorgonomyces haynaldii]
MKKTRFTQKELVQWHRGFVKDCPSGQMDKKDLHNIYKQYFPFGDANKYANAVFGHLDIDKDGFINFDDFIQSLDISAKGSMEEKLEWSFRLYDLDEDGYISHAEMLYIVDSIYRLVGDMNLPKDEEDPQQRVEKVFKLMDLDRDGLLSKEEYIQGGINDPSIVESLNLYAGLL